MNTQLEINWDSLLNSSGVEWKREFSTYREIGERPYSVTLGFSGNMLTIRYTYAQPVRIKNTVAYENRLVRVNNALDCGCFTFDGEEVAYRVSTLRSESVETIKLLMETAESEITEYAGKLLIDPRKARERAAREENSTNDHPRPVENEPRDTYDTYSEDEYDLDENENEGVKSKLLRTLGFKE